MARKTFTTNGAAAHKATGNKLVDLFFNIGASRNNLEGIKKDFTAAFKTDPVKAAAILLWARDIRHDGAGERSVFRTLLKVMAESGWRFIPEVISLISVVGRFDDFKSLYGTPYQDTAVRIWANEIKAGNVLAAKWAKREDKNLQLALGLNEAGLRKKLARLRKEHIVEDKMCKKLWSAIDYSKLPSVAGMRYAKAFLKNDASRYQDFIDSKETKVNAGAAFPHDVYRMYKYGDQRAAASKYWAALPELGLTGSILPMSDVSGSMGCAASGQITCMDVSISLGVYLAQRCKGAFQNMLLTFSENPVLTKLPDTNDIGELFNFTARMNWGMSTNIEKAYEAILKRAVQFKATQEQLPDYILILSDMQFNACVSGRGDTIFKNMEKKFVAAGYKLPKVIFWNLNASYGNFPTSSFDKDVALVSGFSPNVLKAVLNAESVCITPEIIMEQAIAPFVTMLNA